MMRRHIDGKRFHFPYSASRPEVEETNTSTVVLTGRHAYKIKKAVRFPFLDYSTLEKRKACCEEEVRLNRRLAAEVYIGVVPLSVTDDSLVFETDRPADEYAVKMKQLPTERRLDRLLEAGQVGETEVSSIVSRMAMFHASAETETHGWEPPRIMLDGLEQEMGSLIRNRKLISHIKRRFFGFLRRNADRILERAVQGRIKEGHGDLKPENIFYLEEPVIMDCIEFNRQFRFMDTGGDIAFLALGLDFHGRSELAEFLIDGYSRISGDLSLRDVIDFYRCHRATVLAKLCTMGYLRSPSEEAVGEVTRYLALAKLYADRL